jgi:hypothetical protein
MSQPSTFKYTLVLCEDAEVGARAQGASNRLEYFILVVDRIHVFPHLDVEVIPELAKQLDVDPLREYLEGGYYLSDVVNAFEKVMNRLIDKVESFFNILGIERFWT